MLLQGQGSLSMKFSKNLNTKHKMKYGLIKSYNSIRDTNFIGLMKTQKLMTLTTIYNVS